MSREEALKKMNTRWWVGESSRGIVAFQLYEPRLCMPFSDFHKAVEKVLGRPVFTHEFGLNVNGLKAEFEGKRAPASLAEVIGQLSAEKIIIVGVGRGKEQ